MALSSSTSPSSDRTPISALARVRLLVRVWSLTLSTYREMHGDPLPQVMDRLSAEVHGPTATMPVALLSRAVSRGLRIGPWRPRCLVRSLVLFRLLRAQGHTPLLIIGMKDHATTTDAHAWIELDGRDVGPWPGSRGYGELARYPRSASPDPSS